MFLWEQTRSYVIKAVNVMSRFLNMLDQEGILIKGDETGGEGMWMFFCSGSKGRDDWLNYAEFQSSHSILPHALFLLCLSLSLLKKETPVRMSCLLNTLAFFIRNAFSTWQHVKISISLRNTRFTKKIWLTIRMTRGFRESRIDVTLISH